MNGRLHWYFSYLSGRLQGLLMKCDGCFAKLQGLCLMHQLFWCIPASQLIFLHMMALLYSVLTART